ncbi:MAG: matrixin family metalloprotease [Marinobacter sp.]|nr:matrixin family metalloprotease [Marinobacter sp.]
MRAATGARLSLRAFLMAVLLPWALPLPADSGEAGYRLLELEGFKVKWGEQRLGAGANISYAFADRTLHFSDARNCGRLAPMSALAEPDLPFETLVRETEAAFRVWERAANLSFYQVADVLDADIILGAQGQPRRRAFANVAYASDKPVAEDGVRVIEQSLVCLNPDQQWKVGFGGDQNVYDLRYTLVHEIGHAIGLDHPGPSGQVMGFRYTEAFPELQPGDLRGVRRLYGPATNDGQLANNAEAPLGQSSL